MTFRHRVSGERLPRWIAKKNGELRWARRRRRVARLATFALAVAAIVVGAWIFILLGLDARAR